MLSYTIKRLAQSLVTVTIIVTIVFVLIRMLPTDYYFPEDQLMKLTEAQKSEQLLSAGLLSPLPEQLVRYYSQVLQGNLGESRRIQNGVPVVQLIQAKFQISMKFGVTALLLAIAVGVTIGILQTRNKDRFLDHVGTTYTILVNAVPPLVSYSLVLIFGSRVFGFPSLYSTRNPGPSSILPLICLSMTSVAWWALWTRRYMIDEINKDYIKLAKIKGLSTQKIMTNHVLRNAFVPLAQYLPQSFLNTISGSLLVERFFSVPGMGPLLVDSIHRYDTNVVQALVMLYATMGILGIFLGDVLMTIVDPRIRLVSKGGTR